MAPSTDSLQPYRSKVDLVYEYLRGRILSREMHAEQAINIDRLAKHLGVSKIPIREALRRLESQGLVVQTAHVGAMVAPLDLRELRAVCLTRQAFERLVAEEAAMTITGEQADDLERVQVQMRTQLLDQNVDALVDLNLRFHQSIAAATGYRVFCDVTEQLLLTLARYRAAAPLSINDWWTSLSEHQEILDGLREHDADVAGAAAWRHARLRPEPGAPSIAAPAE